MNQKAAALLFLSGYDFIYNVYTTASTHKWSFFYYSYSVYILLSRFLYHTQLHIFYMHADKVKDTFTHSHSLYFPLNVFCLIPNSLRFITISNIFVYYSCEFCVWLYVVTHTPPTSFSKIQYFAYKNERQLDIFTCNVGAEEIW